MTGGPQMTFGIGRPTRAVTALLILCAVFYLLELISFNFMQVGAMFEYLALTPAAVVKRFFVWQPFTYVFLHDPNHFQHIAFNGLLLWFFASPMERELGMARFVRMTIFATAVTGASVIAVGALLRWANLAVPTLSPVHWYGPTIGISGVGLAYLTAWALRNRERTILFFFVLPMRAITMLWITLGIEVVLILTQEAAAWPAHFGGMAFGAVWATAPSWALGDRLRLWRLKRGSPLRRGLKLVTPARAPADDGGDDDGDGDGGQGGGGGPTGPDRRLN
ncbi:MAG TPA: rhomboid family intramembrane serine protease [Myxococcota bacterium]|jgi:membrane associated rhomboid family serine protease|nr:rhomboid family intramembrane serine protease [Myxococcota bacterium]